MSLPHLLLVDDSEAILAYETAALSGHYSISTALNGVEALKKADELRPSAILLDLSMPEMSGDEVLVRIKANPDLTKIPVIIISSEKERAESCLKKGAHAYLPKPIRADEVRLLVGRVLEEARRKDREGSVSVLFMGVGPVEVAIPLDCVRSVLLQPEIQPLATGTSYVAGVVDVHGQPVCVLDMSRPLRVEHEESVSERKLVVIHQSGVLLALSVDRVRDPEELTPDQILHREALVGPEGRLVNQMLKAVLQTQRGPIPVLDPGALLSRRMLRNLSEILKDYTTKPPLPLAG